MIVEDDRHQRLLLEEELASDGHVTSSAADGHEAVEQMKLSPPDLVILDIGLPGGMDGLELLDRLLAINRQLPVVIYTAYECCRGNSPAWVADAWVLKQCDVTPLKQALRRVLASRRTSQPDGLLSESPERPAPGPLCQMARIGVDAG